MKASILIPSYNCEDTLPETLNSIQAIPNLEQYVQRVVVADDASQDDTVLAAQEAWKVDVPLRVLKSENNKGERANVNKALASLSDQVDWIFILHADDLAKRHWLEIMHNRANICPERVASICSSWDTLKRDGEIVPGEDKLQCDVNLHEGTDKAVRNTLLRGCWWHISGCAIRLSAFEEIGPFSADMPALGDWEWLLRCFKKGHSVEYIPRTLIIYRKHEESVSAESFRTGGGMREKVRILQQYRSFLSTSDLYKLRFQMLYFLGRRLLRSLLNANAERCVHTLKAAKLVASFDHKTP